MTPIQIAELRELIEDSPELLALKQNYPAIAGVLNARPWRENPVMRTKTLKRRTINEIFQAITPAEALELYKIPNFRADVERALASGDEVGLQNYLMIASSLLSVGSLAALGELLQETEDDPTWTETMAGDSIAMERGWGRGTEHDVQAALT